MKIALAQLNYTIGDFAKNFAKILEAIEKAKKEKIDLVVFSELALSGYPPEDLLFFPEFVDAMQKLLEELASRVKELAIIVGCARRNPLHPKKLFNSACLIQEGKIVDFYDKRLLPNYNVFSEPRYFDPGEETKIWNIKGKKVAPTICEDIWQHSEFRDDLYPIDPVALIKNNKPDMVINLSASPYYFNRGKVREQMCRVVARSLNCPLYLVNQVGGNDSYIFDGSSVIIDAKGEIIANACSFKEELLIDTKKERKEEIEELYDALVLGTRDYVKKTGFEKVIFGLSGGIDSAVVSAIAADAFGKENVSGISMPSRYTPKRSKIEAKEQAALVGIHFQELSIDELYAQFLEFFSPIFQQLPVDHTEENLQARIRGMILMTLSNKFGSLVLAAGNKSEMAMGYSTLYGDMCGGLEVIADVYKKDVYRLAKWLEKKNKIYPSILTKEPSAELAFNQKDTDTLPEYDIVDRIVESYLEEEISPKKIAHKERIDLSIVEKLVHKIHKNEYKRQQSPIALRVTKRAFTKGRFVPIVQKWDQL